MGRLIRVSLITLLSIAATIGVSCTSSHLDPDAPEAIELQSVNLGDQPVNFTGVNLAYLNDKTRVQLDLSSENPLELAEIEQSLLFDFYLDGDDAPPVFDPKAIDPSILHWTRSTLDAGGTIRIDDAEAGLVSFYPFAGDLGGVLSPGVRYTVFLRSLHATVDSVSDNTFSVLGDSFVILPLSRRPEHFLTDLTTDGLVQHINLGGIEVQRVDDVMTLAPLSSLNTVRVQLATNVNPATFEDDLSYSLVINNLTRNQTYEINETDLESNGVFTYPDARNNVILWTKNAGGLDSFVNSDGANIDTSDVGDEVEYQLGLVRSTLNDGLFRTFRDKKFRILHTFS
ncbi:MAG: hypothetical protein ABI743_03095 [bacterium]